MWVLLLPAPINQCRFGWGCHRRGLLWIELRILNEGRDRGEIQRDSYLSLLGDVIWVWMRALQPVWECLRTWSVWEDGSDGSSIGNDGSERERTTDVVLASWIDMKYLCVTGMDGVRFRGVTRMLVGLGSAGVRSGGGRLDCEWRAQEPVSACLGLRRRRSRKGACPSGWDCVGRNKAIDGRWSWWSDLVPGI